MLPFRLHPDNPAFHPDLVVIGVLAMLLAGLLLGSAAGKGRPRYLLLELLGGTPRNLDFLRDAIQARALQRGGGTLLFVGAGLFLAGFLFPGTSSWAIQVGGAVTVVALTGVFLFMVDGYVVRTLRRYLRDYLRDHPFSFDDNVALTREIGELFGVATSGEETLEGYSSKVRSAIGIRQTSSGAYRRSSRVAPR